MAPKAAKPHPGNLPSGIAEDPFKKAHPKHALYYREYQLPDHLYISLRIISIKGARQC